MFAGLKYLVLLFILPFLVWIFIIGIKNRNNSNGKLIFIGFAIGILFIGIVWTISFLKQKMTLDKTDYYGEYIIDRNYFSGKQTDWQYNHFRIKITDTDSIFLYVTEKQRIIKTYKGTITTVDLSSSRLVINMDQPTHHILTTNPTTYREPWDFYLVFNSPKFNNMFFRKGKWKEIEK